MAGIQLRTEPVRTIAAASIGATYSVIGSAITNQSRIMFLQNLTDATLMFSMTGLTDHFPLPANGFLLLDVCSNQVQESGYFIQAGSPISVKQLGVPTTGSVYLTVFFANTL